MALETGPLFGNNSSAEPIAARQWLVNALSEKLNGPSAQYNFLLGEAEKVRENPAALKILSQSVSNVDERAHEVFLSKIFGGSLWTSADEVNAALLEFAVNLASANTAGCLPLCLEMLVRNFIPPALQPGARVTSEVLESQLARKEAVLGAVHKTLERLMDLVPTATTRLQPIVLRRMPHKRLDREVQSNYLESMFRLADGRKGDLLRDKLLTAVVDHLIEVDVEIKWEDILEKEREEDSDDEDDLHFDVDLDEHGDDAVRKEHPLSRTKETATPLDETADKMDAMMCLTFEHLQRQAAEGRLDETFETLLNSFQTTILHTYRSKFTQFLLFYLCSLDPPRLSAAFADLLVGTVAGPSNSYKTRMAGAAYLASFLARADYVPLSVVSSALKRLADWAVSYVRMLASSRVGDLLMANPDSLPPGAGVHGVFYSACQAIFYILCYRMDSLSKDPQLSKALQQLPLQEIVRHALNPMKVCLPAVVKEFCNQAAAFNLLDCSDVLQRNDRSETRSGARHNKLDMFFPFDPYLLPASLKYVEQHYNEWKPRGPSHEDDEEGEEEEEGFQETGSSDQNGAESSDEDDYAHVGPKSMDLGRTPEISGVSRPIEGTKVIGSGLVWGSGAQSDVAMSHGCTPMSYTQASSLKQLPAVLHTGFANS